MPVIKSILFAPHVVEKLWRRHGLTQLLVEDVVFSPDSEARWDIDPAHGGRLILRGMTAEPAPRSVFVALEPLDPQAGVWACITAFVPTDPAYGTDDDAEA